LDPEFLMTGALRVGSVEPVDEASVPHLDKTVASEDGKEVSDDSGSVSGGSIDLGET
jgi:hypothetical protein